jgi:hypothetical protein
MTNWVETLISLVDILLHQPPHLSLFFFWTTNILLLIIIIIIIKKKNQVYVQDKEKPVKEVLQNKGVVYKQNTNENTKTDTT